MVAHVESLRQSLADKHRQYVLKSIEAGRLRQQLAAVMGQASDWQFVPKKPTCEMLEAGAEAPDDDDWQAAMAKAYKAMLAAAPATPSPAADARCVVCGLPAKHPQCDECARLRVQRDEGAQP